jgi:hypothetical protein
LTPISEARDNLAWAKEIYAPLVASCDQGCVSEGWGVQVLAILGTIGHAGKAVEQTLQLSPSVYEGPGGNGHSKSNTVWYIATRPTVDDPYPEENLQLIEIQELTCSQPSTCTREYLSSMAGEYSCRSRIEWLMNVEDLPETTACAKIAGEEYQAECGLCFPSGAIYNKDVEGNDAEMGGNSTQVNASATDSPINQTLMCSQAATCTDEVLDTLAAGLTCRARIEYLIEGGQSEQIACHQVAAVEFVDECGPCRPQG